MKSPSTIQRCKFKDHKGEVESIDKILEYDNR
jgi:hypothetical protein